MKTISFFSKGRITMLGCAGFFSALALASSLLADDAAPAAAPAPIPAPALDAPFSPFGIGGCNARTRDHNFSTWIPQMAAIGIHEARGLGGTGWGGQADRKWDTLDWQYDYLISQGVRPGGGFYNYRQGKSGLPMDDLPGYTADVTNVVNHFKGKIKYWEIWNEPPNGTARGQTAQDYGKYCAAVYDAVKAADSSCLVGLAAQSANLNYLDQAIQGGAKDHFDYITLHPYETLGCLMDVPGSEGLFMNIVPATRKMLAAQDPALVNAPVIFTEIGFDSKRGANKQAIALIKTYTMGIAQGVACVQWFEGMDGDSGPMGLIAGNGQPRPAYTALGQMIKALGQHPAYLGWVLLNDKDNKDNQDYGFVFQGDKDPILITWGEKGRTDNVDLGQQVSVIDPMTGTATQTQTTALSEPPVIVDPAPAAIVTQAKADKAKPFPWGGDYTDAKSVSVTYGTKNEEKGLHTFSGDAIAANVILYGGNARSGNAPGGTTFAVDPNFLTYDAVPIDISVVVRRDEKNDPAKIDLEYESTTGYKKPGAKDIPEGNDWQTLTWHISDPQFVAKWGFNIRFNSGNYAIQSVTVTKS